MTRLSIDLPEDVKTRLEARVARSGHASVEEFVQALLLAEAESPGEAEDYAGPHQLTYRTEEELESLLLRRIDDARAPIEATPEFWQEFQRRVEARRRKGA